MLDFFYIKKKIYFMLVYLFLKIYEVGIYLLFLFMFMFFWFDFIDNFYVIFFLMIKLFKNFIYMDKLILRVICMFDYFYMVFNCIYVFKWDVYYRLYLLYNLGYIGIYVY